MKLSWDAGLDIALCVSLCNERFSHKTCAKCYTLYSLGTFKVAAGGMKTLCTIVYGAHGIKCDKEPLNRTSHMGNYLRVPCHVTMNLVTGGDANCDPSTWAKITPTSHDLQTAEMKVRTLVSPKLMHFVSTLHMYTDKQTSGDHGISDNFKYLSQLHNIHLL